VARFINQQIIGGVFAPDHWLGYLIAALIHLTLLLTLVAVAALFFIWLERKVSGRIQDRLGPTRVGGMFGWLQTLADGLKLITKEDLMPADADRFLFKIAPYVSFAASFAAYLALPFASGPVAWVGQHLNVATFFVLAVLGMEVFGVILGGYASGSKWSLFGAMREAAQVVSYEVPLGLCAAVPVMIAGTMDLVAIGNMQQGLITNWLVFHDPFAFLTFWLFIVCAMAGVNRAPFDLAEAESELVAGFLTEYSGLRWSIFFMAEYGSMLAVSILAAILFLGAWHGPIPVFGPHMLDWAEGPGAAAWTLTGYLASLAGCLNLLTKGVAGVVVMIWVRWTLPRLRIDQVIIMCWKYCTPIVCFTFVGTTLWMLAWPGGVGLLPAPPQALAAVREAQPPARRPAVVAIRAIEKNGAAKEGAGTSRRNRPEDPLHKGFLAPLASSGQWPVGRAEVVQPPGDVGRGSRAR
jgi:NADH-quinone oxidoreductase subunit H